MKRLRFLLPLMAMLVLTSARLHGQQLDLVQNQPPPWPSLDDDSHRSLSSSPDGIWADRFGEGYRKGAMEFEGTLGAGVGLREGGGATHDIALSELRVGKVFTKLLGQGCWYQGNIEMLGELFVGAQFHPEARYFVGILPVFRYNWILGGRWVPFIDLGAGVAATQIGGPDLGCRFEFNLQAGPGVKYYFRDNLAFIGQWRYFHFSDGGITTQNKGVNVSTILLGVSWAF